MCLIINHLGHDLGRVKEILEMSQATVPKCCKVLQIGLCLFNSSEPAAKSRITGLCKFPVPVIPYYHRTVARPLPLSNSLIVGIFIFNCCGTDPAISCYHCIVARPLALSINLIGGGQVLTFGRLPING